MILHIPHSSIDIPDTFEVLNGVSLRDEFQRMTDWYTDELFDFDDAKKLIFPYSRLYCDVERFRNDEDESMAQKGMGVCYTSTSYGTKLREISSEEKEFIKSTIYDRHHKKFELLVEEELKEHGEALIIDCHSFSNEVLTYHEENTNRPDICIGIDRFHTDFELIRYVREYFLEEGLTVLIDEPFSGTIVPLKYYRKDKRVKSIMIEVNRKLYLNEKFGKNENFNRVKTLIGNLLNKINNKLYVENKNTIEYRMGVDFKLINQWNQVKKEAKELLSNNLEIQMLQEFVFQYKKMIVDLEKRANSEGKEYRNEDKKKLEMLQLYIDFEAENNLAVFFKLYNTSTSNETMLELVSNMYVNLCKDCPNIPQYKFSECQSPFLHILRYKDKTFETYRWKDVTLKITFPFTKGEQVQARPIYAYTIKWALSSYLESIDFNDGVWSFYNKDIDSLLCSKYTEFKDLDYPTCEFLYKGGKMNLNEMNLTGELQNLKTILRYKNNPITISLENLNEVFLKFPPCNLSNLTIEIYGDFEYFSF